jgi:hypothetical protein
MQNESAGWFVPHTSRVNRSAVPKQNWVASTPNGSIAIDQFE